MNIGLNLFDLFAKCLQHLCAHLDENLFELRSFNSHFASLKFKMGHKTDLWDKEKYLCSKHSRNETPLEIDKIISSDVFEDHGQHQN